MYYKDLGSVEKVQWGFKKSQPLFYWKAFKKEDNKDGQILDRLNTAHEIYSIFTRDKKIKKTEAELKIIFNTDISLVGLRMMKI